MILTFFPLCVVDKLIKRYLQALVLLEDMKASSILGSVILVLIIMGAPLLVNPVHASAILPTITCWDGTTIGPVNGTYVAHCSPAPVCPPGQSPMPDRTCLPPCGGSGNMTCMWKFAVGNNTQSNIAEQFMYKSKKYTDYVFNSGTTICDQQGLECYALGLAAWIGTFRNDLSHAI